jgi:hypothetical protein
LLNHRRKKFLGGMALKRFAPNAALQRWQRQHASDAASCKHNLPHEWLAPVAELRIRQRGRLPRYRWASLFSARCEWQPWTCRCNHPAVAPAAFEVAAIRGRRVDAIAQRHMQRGGYARQAAKLEPALVVLVLRGAAEWRSSCQWDGNAETRGESRACYPPR